MSFTIAEALAMSADTHAWMHTPAPEGIGAAWHCPICTPDAETLVTRVYARATELGIDPDYASLDMLADDPAITARFADLFVD